MADAVEQNVYTHLKPREECRYWPEEAGPMVLLGYRFPDGARVIASANDIHGRPFVVVYTRKPYTRRAKT